MPTPSPLAFVMGLVVLSVISLLVYLASHYEKVGPNEVLIVSGRRSVYRNPQTGEDVQKNFRIFHGGGTFVFPIRERIDRMSVELMTLEIETPPFFTKFGVPIVVDGIAQIKVMSDDPLSIATAAEMFLSKSEEEMNHVAHQMMQGHLRAVISTLPFEEIHANPEAFAQSVQRLTAEDLANMGIQVVSFTIREVNDPSGYMQALGRPQMAEVKRDAILGEANANRDATGGKAAADRDAAVSLAECTRIAELAKISSELAIADASSKREAQVFEQKARVAQSKAASDMSYELEQTRVRQQLVEEQLRVEKIERELGIELAQLEVARQEQLLDHDVRKPAEAERFRVETLAAAEQTRLRSMAEAEAEAIRSRGAAEAESIRLKELAKAEGVRAHFMAEAEGMQAKALAWKNYSAAAVGQLVVEKLPEIAAAVAAPLSKIDRIVLVNTGGGGDTGIERVTQGVTNVIAQVPAVVEAMTGFDLRGLMSQLPSYTSVGGEAAHSADATATAPTSPEAPPAEAPTTTSAAAPGSNGSSRLALASPKTLGQDDARGGSGTTPSGNQ